MKKFKLKQLEKMPTLHQGQFDDLKVETKDTRIWLSRMTIEDGMEYNNQVTEEKYWLQPKRDVNGKVIRRDITLGKTWQTARQYQAI